MLNLNNINWVQATRLHEVSNEGQIRNMNGRYITPWVSTTGYYTIKIWVGDVRKNKKLHRLIAEAFIPNPDSKPHVNHIDGNKLNNRVCNLEWCTHSENMEHASETQLMSHVPRNIGVKLSNVSKYHNVGWDKTRGKWTAAVTHNKKVHMRKRFNTEEEAALHVNHIINTLGLTNRPRNIIY